MFFGKKFSGHHGTSLSGLEILVLSLIKNNSEITGYDITREINNKFKPIWNASAGTIYPLLDRLIGKVFVKAEEIIDENNRKKKIYTIAQRGLVELEDALEGHFEPSLKTLGTFIRTIMEGIKIDDDMEQVFSCFPFCDRGIDREINKNDLSRENIEYIKKTIKSLKHREKKLKYRLNKMKNQIKSYEDILKIIIETRENNAKPIPIVDDDKEFEDF
ncbi:MAG: helix-turn-helix transcriptional regulator [Candidatus Lokiarchaeota archaeon]|nr:helix-turn-helix transcriptional regulator [Candidatus Lokiarchaeota archaeon]